MASILVNPATLSYAWAAYSSYKTLNGVYSETSTALSWASWAANAVPFRIPFRKKKRTTEKRIEDMEKQIQKLQKQTNVLLKPTEEATLIESKDDGDSIVITKHNFIFKSTPEDYDMVILDKGDVDIEKKRKNK